MTIARDRRQFLQTSLAAGAVLGLAGASPRPIGAPAPEFNPPVAPGRVRWRENFASACAASRSSGKPVLLFHMMGRLDQRFC